MDPNEYQQHIITDLERDFETVMTAVYNLGAVDVAIQAYDTGLRVPTAVAEEAALSDNPDRRLIAVMGGSLTADTRALLGGDRNGWVRFFAKHGSRESAFF